MTVGCHRKIVNTYSQQVVDEKQTSKAFKTPVGMELSNSKF